MIFGVPGEIWPQKRLAMVSCRLSRFIFRASFIVYLTRLRDVREVGCVLLPV